MLVATFVSVLWVISWALSRVYSEKLNIDYYDDEEPPPPKIPYPSGPYYWSRTPYQVKFLHSALGNIFAGRAEFPWVVDIRAVGGEDQNQWAIGNLLTDRHVMTTCRFVVYFAHGNIQSRFDPKVVLLHSEILVHYFSSYVWEETSATIQIKSSPRPQDVPTTYTSGSRSVKLLIAHPKCDDNPIEADVGLIELADYLFPSLPFINYMPVPVAPSQAKLANFNMKLQRDKRIVCHVGSIGRNWANWKNHMALDYKVKYRVYNVQWHYCVEAWGKGFYDCRKESAEYQSCTGGFAHPLMTVRRMTAGWAAVKCFTTYSPVGTICDHDVGAPLVCNNAVYGIVTRAASPSFCNDVIPVPFFVLKITAAADYFATYARAFYRYPPLVNDKPFSLTGISIPPIIYSAAPRLFGFYGLLLFSGFSAITCLTSPM